MESRRAPTLDMSVQILHRAPSSCEAIREHAAGPPPDEGAAVAAATLLSFSISSRARYPRVALGSVRCDALTPRLTVALRG